MTVRSFGNSSGSVTLGRLFRNVSATLSGGAASTVVNGLACDSRAVRPGDLFLALPGTQTDGSRFIEDAARRGAVAGGVSIRNGATGRRRAR